MNRYKRNQPPTNVAGGGRNNDSGQNNSKEPLAVYTPPTIPAGLKKFEVRGIEIVPEASMETSNGSQSQAKDFGSLDSIVTLKNPKTGYWRGFFELEYRETVRLKLGEQITLHTQQSEAPHLPLVLPQYFVESVESSVFGKGGENE
jgi:hypothetical protein